MNLEEDNLIRGPRYIICPVCNDRAERVGAQDYCDAYVCEKQHLTRIKIGSTREIWNGKET